MILGGPLPHVMAAKAVALREASAPSFRDYARRVVENAQALAAACQQQGLHVVTGGTDNHLLLVDVGRLGLDGPAGRGRAAQVRHHAEPERVAGRPERPLVHQRAEAGDARADDAGAWRRRNGGHRAGGRPRAARDPPRRRQPRQVRLAPEVAAEARAAVHALTDAFPLYPELGNIDPNG